MKACEKRPVSLRQLEEVTQSVERELRNLGISEVKSDMIGEIVMEELRDIDDVAYVRFASVYRQFKDLNVFIEELKDILQKERE
ncbi:ATP cone domain-containing protein [Bacillus cereus]